MKIRMSWKICCTVFAFLVASTHAFAADKIVALSKSDFSLKLEVENAIGKGLAWLATKQKPEGYWGQQEYPALTGLVLTGFQGDRKSVV